MRLPIRFFIGILFCWYIGTFPAPAKASTDPQSATVSATATVQRTTPTTSDTTAPTPPILIRPTDGTVTSDNHPEFVWHESTDDNSNTVIYTLYLNGVATYLGVSGLGNSSGAGYTARIEGGDIRLLPNRNLPDGLYTWYVTANDLSLNTSRSQVWSLRIDTTAPPLTLVDLDIYHNPEIIEGSNFEIAGPKDIYFTLLSDPFVTIQISLSCTQGSELSAVCSKAQDSSEPLRLRSTTNSVGLAYLYQHLVPGVYSVAITATDAGNNTTILPTFTLSIIQAIAIITIPGVPTIKVPYSPYSLPSLPATIARLQTIAYRLPIIILSLLAIAIFLLLIPVWRRRYNLILFDSDFQPIHHATIYHSLPYTPGVKGSHTPGVLSILHTSYYKSHIPHLGRYSTLTIRTQDATYILSLSVKRTLYTLILG